MKICTLASGSKGNSVYVNSGETSVLIDAGLSATETLKRLALAGIDSGGISAILVTHDHNDHVAGAGVLARKLKIPVIISYLTMQACTHLFKKCEMIEFESGYPFTFRDLHIDPFITTHDAVDPIGYLIESTEGRFGHATDFGITTRVISEKLKGCRALLIEANHDLDMLMNGPYPWHLKQRIKSSHGHISNNQSMELLNDLLHEELEGVFLAHISEVNNDPAIPHRVATELLANQNRCNPQLFIADQYIPSSLLAI